MQITNHGVSFMPEGNTADVRDDQPNVFGDAIGQLSSSFSTAIAVVEGELPSGLGTKAKNLIDRLKEMQAEVDGWRQGKPLADRESTEHNEDVSRQSREQVGGLYKD